MADLWSEVTLRGPSPGVMSQLGAWVPEVMLQSDVCFLSDVVVGYPLPGGILKMNVRFLK